MSTAVHSEALVVGLMPPTSAVTTDVDMTTLLVSPTWDPALLDLHCPEMQKPFTSLSEGTTDNLDLTASIQGVRSPSMEKHPLVDSIDRPVPSVEPGSLASPSTSEAAGFLLSQPSLLLTQPVGQKMSASDSTNAHAISIPGNEFNLDAFNWPTNTTLDSVEPMMVADWVLPANAALPLYLFEPITGSRRRSCSMPPEPLPTFHRTMANGTPVNISRPIGRDAGARRDPWRGQRPAAQINRPTVLRGYTTIPTTHTNNASHGSHSTLNGFIPPNRDVKTQCPVSAADSSCKSRPIKRQRTTARGHPESSSAISNIQHYTAPLICQIDLLKDFVVRTMEDYKAGQHDEVETIRARQRAHNRSLMDMHAPFEILEGLSNENQWMDVPRTGLDIRAARQQVMSAVLEAYAVPFVSTMFLFEKKLLYMQFIGASHPFMHLVLDHIE